MALPIFDIIKIILDWVKQYQDGQNRLDEKHTEALRAILLATTETETYIADSNRTSKGDRQKERELSKLWTEAGILLRAINLELGELCVTKGFYWTNPESWDKNQLDDARIDLATMRRQAESLLSQ